MFENDIVKKHTPYLSLAIRSEYVMKEKITTEMNEDELKSSLANDVSAIFVPESDFVMAVIRSHLYTEYLVEQIINNQLPNGERITKTGKFTYSHKLIVLSSLNVVKDEVIASLRSLNKIRNECAHEIHHEITKKHLEDFRSPLGNLKKTVEELDHAYDLKSQFGRTVVYICAHLASAAYNS